MSTDLVKLETQSFGLMPSVHEMQVLEDWISERSHQEKSVIEKAQKSKCRSALALAALCEVGP